MRTIDKSSLTELAAAIKEKVAANPRSTQNVLAQAEQARSRYRKLQRRPHTLSDQGAISHRTEHVEHGAQWFRPGQTLLYRDPIWSRDAVVEFRAKEGYLALVCSRGQVASRAGRLAAQLGAQDLNVEAATPLVCHVVAPEFFAHLSNQ